MAPKKLLHAAITSITNIFDWLDFQQPSRNLCKLASVKNLFTALCINCCIPFIVHHVHDMANEIIKNEILLLTMVDAVTIQLDVELLFQQA